MWEKISWRLLGCAVTCGLGLPAVAKDKPEAILLAARKATDAQAWSVEARVNADKNMKITGIMFGKDFDLTIETVDGVTRMITLGDKNWSSEDGGKTWKTVEVADRRFYYLVHTPVKSTIDGKIPPFEALGTEKLAGESLLHIRYISPEKVQYEGDRPNYWIAVDDKHPPVIHRYFGQAAFDNAYYDDKVDYKLVTEKNPVVPPPGNPLATAPAPGPERLLMAAMKKMSSGVWEVKGTWTAKKMLKLQGLLEGENFDITMEPGSQPDVPLREIMIGDKAWICSDGKSWHAGISQDRLVYNVTHTPILYGRLEPPFQKLDSEERNGVTWLHIRLQVPDAKVDPKSLPQYWLVLDGQGEALYIGRTEMPMISRGTTDVTYCAFDYTPSKGTIAPPPASAMKPAASNTPGAPNALAFPAATKAEALPAPLDDRAHGFEEIETHKYDWADKIIRVEVTPKLLQTLDLQNGSFRVMLKDSTQSAISYGQVEFPGEALVSLGFVKKTAPGNHNWLDYQQMGALGRTEGEPVSFFVRVVPIGKKPAARCIAVGSKLLPETDGHRAYSW